MAKVLPRPQAVITNGEGYRTKAHLNLTRSLAHVWGIKALLIPRSPYAGRGPQNNQPPVKPRA